MFDIAKGGNTYQNEQCYDDGSRDNCHACSSVDSISFSDDIKNDSSFEVFEFCFGYQSDDERAGELVQPC
jgi:hypothetical protein